MLKTYAIIQQLAAEDNLQDNNENMIQRQDAIPSTSRAANENFSRLTQHLHSLMQSRPACSSTTRNMNIKQKLNFLCDRQMEPFESNILDYWKKQKHDTELVKLAQVALAVPATQVSVERAFSALATILTKLRSKLSSTTLNCILLVKLNFDLIKNNNLDLSRFNSDIENI